MEGGDSFLSGHQTELPHACDPKSVGGISNAPCVYCLIARGCLGLRFAYGVHHSQSPSRVGCVSVAALRGQNIPRILEWFVGFPLTGTSRALPPASWRQQRFPIVRTEVMGHLEHALRRATLVKSYKFKFVFAIKVKFVLPSTCRAIIPSFQI